MDPKLQKSLLSTESRPPSRTGTFVCKHCLTLTDRPTTTDPGEPCPRCKQTDGWISDSGIVQSTGDWACSRCPRMFERWRPQCPDCGRLVVHATRAKWGAAFATRLKNAKALHVVTWSQGRSGIALDPATAEGFCRAMCMLWLVKQANGEDFWSWMARPSAMAVIINLQVRYQRRQQVTNLSKKEQLEALRKTAQRGSGVAASLEHRRITLWKRLETPEAYAHTLPLVSELSGLEELQQLALEGQDVTLPGSLLLRRALALKRKNAKRQRTEKAKSVTPEEFLEELRQKTQAV